MQTRLIEADTGSDQVGVKSSGAGSGDEFGEIDAGQRFATCKMRVQHAELAGLLKDAAPLGGGKLRLGSGKLQRVRAIDTVQRAAMRDFGDER